MAGTAAIRKLTSLKESAEREAVIQHNKMMDDIEVLRAGLAALAAAYNLALTKLDADEGVTDTDYNSTHGVVATSYDAAADMVAANIQDASGHEITA